MNIFFDTTVLVAASTLSHPHYAQARPALLRVASGEDKGFISAHSIAEVYAALTRLPVVPRIHPVEAQRIIRGNLLPNFELVPVSTEDYLDALGNVSGKGWSGAKIYDALLLSCAEKCAADRIYTFNLGDFRALASAEMLAKICAP